jgi:cytochrome c2
LTRASRLHSRLALSAALAVGVVVLSGCGTGGVDSSSNTTGGKELFVKNCGSCHTLADAGTTGKIGPDLDAAFGPSRAQGFSVSTIRQIVRDQIHLPSPPAGVKNFPTMPADLVKGSDADAVAAYVASVAGTGATPTPSTTTTAPPPPPPPTTTTGPTPSGGNAAKGKSLYASLGCKSCHSIDGSKGIGPTFKGLFGSKVKLTNGQTVTADMAYLIQSIEDPDKQIVQGFAPGIMSATIKPHSVAMADAQDLAAYIKTLR